VHRGQSFVVPLEQAKLLDAFDLVLAPYEVEKQDNNLDEETGEVDPNKEVIVLGFKISARDLTFAIPNAWLSRFAAASDRFEKGVALPLSEWRSWLGKANYASTSVPHIRWRLNLLRKRLAKLEAEKGKDNPRIKYRVKEDEAEAISEFTRNAVGAEPLSIYDSILQVWPKNAMDVVVYSDSCGQTNPLVPSSGGGLGFYVSSKYLQHDYAFAYRHDKPFLLNNHAEGAASYLGFLYALKLVPHAKRILLYTDSSDVVYVADAGKGEDSLNRLAMRMRVLSKARKVDYRVRWIPGDKNDIADALSRKPFHELYRTWGERLSSITVDQYVLEGAC
jgi:ribonuclease HI